MPNAANVESPIVLIGTGRSGTSLVSKIFDSHPDCVSVGETANLIFGPWQAVEESSAMIRPLSRGSDWIGDDDRAARAVRALFLSCLPDDARHWMQKPIGVPKAVSDRFEDIAGDAATSWYWRVMRTTFPKARYLAITRHPCDIVLSGRAWWGYSEASLWTAIATMAAYLLHRDSPVDLVIGYEDLTSAPEHTVRAICDAVGLAFTPEMIRAFDEVHVPTPGREAPGAFGYTRRAAWGELDPTALLPAQRDLIEQWFLKRARPLEWPDHFAASHRVAREPASVATPLGPTELHRLQAQIAQVNWSLERAKLEHAAELRKRDEAWMRREQAFMAREQEMGRLWSEQQAWIAHLEEVKTWYQEQVSNWQRQAERLRAAS